MQNHGVVEKEKMKTEKGRNWIDSSHTHTDMQVRDGGMQ